MAKINWRDVPSWLDHALNSKINILLPILLTLAHKSNCSNDGKSFLCPVCGKPFLYVKGSLSVYGWWWAQWPTLILFNFHDIMKVQDKKLSYIAYFWASNLTFRIISISFLSFWGKGNQPSWNVKKAFSPSTKVYVL